MELRAPIFQIIHLVSGLKLNDVFFSSRRHIQEHHAPANAGLEIQIFVQLHVRPEVDQLDLRVAGANPVDASEALNDPDRIPMNIVIDEVVAVLEVLAFRNAICGDQKIDLSLRRKFGRAFFRLRRESTQNAAHISAHTRQRRPVRSGAADNCAV